MVNFNGLRSQQQPNSCCLSSTPMPIPSKKSKNDDSGQPINNSCPSISPSDDGYDPEVGSVSSTPLFLIPLRTSSSDQSQCLSPNRVSYNNSPAQSTKIVIENKYDNDFLRLAQPCMSSSSSQLPKKLIAPPIDVVLPKVIPNIELPEYSIAKANKEFNRYSDVIPKNDLIYAPVEFENRELQSYYLNANKITLEAGKKNFACIATQGPMEKTLNEFWKAIVVGGHSHIFNLAMDIENYKPKCHNYWSSSDPFVIRDGTEKLGTVQKIKEEVLEAPKSTSEQPKAKRSYACNFSCVQQQKQKIVKRTFEFVSASTGETREIVQFHYNNWPDHGAPERGPFKQLQEIFDGCTHDGVPVTHCSAGIGRTGTLFAVDVLINRLKAEIELSSEDIIDLIREMRDQRKGMVQSDDQLELIYSCVNDYPGLADK